MKKFTFVLMMMLAYAGFTMAQTIENFEPKFQMRIFSAGKTGSVTTVANPDSSIANPSSVVGHMHRSQTGDRWQGWYSPLTTTIDATVTPYLHLKIRKPVISPTCFKLEGGVDPLHGGTGDFFPMSEYSTVDQWQELVYDFSAFPYSYKQIAFIPDFPATDAGKAEMEIYFDDIYFNNDPTIGSPPVQKIADFEHIKLNIMLNNPATDLSTFTFVANPDKSGGNASDHVIKFHRDMDGQPWGGFWSSLPTPIDVTSNHYVHVRVWKSRISPLRFKLEGGPTGTKEFETNTQTKINQWEDIVFDVTEFTGAYPIIAFMPDFITPVGLTEDITIYFDDIVVNNDPTPRANTYQILNVNMAGSGITAGQKVFHSGSFGGAYGTWNEPGANLMNEMTDPNGDGIFTDTVYVNNGFYELKFFKEPTWATGDPTGNRILNVNGGFKMDYNWGTKSATLTLNVDMHGSGLTPGQPVYFAGNFKGTYGDWNKPGDNMNNLLTDADGDSIYTAVLQLGAIGDYAFKFFKGAGWDGGEWVGDPNRTLVVAADMVGNYIWGSNGMVGVRPNALAGKIQMYPNPVRNELTINSTSDISKVIITNTVGKVVGNINYTGNQNINTSNLTKGMYFVTFIGSDGNKVTQKLIKD